MGIIDDYLNRKKMEEMYAQAQQAGQYIGQQAEGALQGIGNMAVQGLQKFNEYEKPIRENVTQAFQATKTYGQEMYRDAGVMVDKVKAAWNAPPDKYGIPRNIDARTQEAKLFAEEEAERQRRLQQGQ